VDGMAPAKNHVPTARTAQALYWETLSEPSHTGDQ
jgi:hypothetical protein